VNVDSSLRRVNSVTGCFGLMIVFFFLTWGVILQQSGFWYFTFGLSLSNRDFMNVSNSSFGRLFSDIVSLLTSEFGEFIYCLFQTMKCVKKELCTFNVNACACSGTIRLKMFCYNKYLQGENFGFN
jgi:hypothetical protein